MEKIEENTCLEFKWLKKRGVGGKKKEIQFYESFIYEGVEYALYDCVYMYKEGLPEPYIGKLIKIWELPDKTKKVKVQWFFRPAEILNWLGDTKTDEKEILLASGEGVGLANINPLEAIAGKCNAVCVSKDYRNLQPSDEELEATDYIFYRTFDVQSCTILDKMDDKVGGLEVKYIFNRKEDENIVTIPKRTLNQKEENKNTVCSEPPQLSTKSPSVKLKMIEDGNDNQLIMEVNAKGESQVKDVQKSLVGSEAVSEVKPSFGVGMDSSKVGKSDGCVVNSGKDKMTSSKVSLKQVEVKDINKIPTGSNKLRVVPFGMDEADKDETEMNIVPNSKAETMERANTFRGLNKLQDRPSKKHKLDDYKPPKDKLVEVFEDSNRLMGMPSKKSKVDNSIKLPMDGKLKHEEMLPLHDNDLKALVASGKTEEKPNRKKGKVLELDKEMISPKAIGDLEGPILKKERVARVLDNKNNNSIKNLGNNKNGHNGKDSVASFGFSEEKSKSSLALDFSASNKEPKKEQHDDKKRKLSMIKSPKVSGMSTHNDKKITYQEFVVGPKPIDDRKAWFKLLPWEERLHTAYGQGTTVLLHNLDPDYTSGEVEDIIWHALMEHCDATMLQRNAVSSPHCGQAFIILKSKEVAQRVLKKLDDECLMLPSGRPLVGTACPPILLKKHSKFFGHLVIDKLKIQNQRELEEAVSTSHYSQPNTIEYDMAMEWFLLQQRAQKWWNMIHKQQGDEQRKLEANLRRKKT